MATKLHELLAVEGNLQSQAEATRTDLKNTFEKKTTHFFERLTVFKSSQENVEPKTEAQLALQTTVVKELDWISTKISAALDIGFQIDTANTEAKADVALANGDVLLRAVPATQLMRLEHRVKELKGLILAVPTLDPSKGFEPDLDRGAGIYKARTVEKARTEKQFDFRVMVPATDKHPAQVKELMVDKPIGTIVSDEWCSMITVAEKGDMLDRVEELARAVKKAKSKANDIDVDVRDKKIGDTLLKFVFKGEKP